MCTKSQLIDDNFIPCIEESIKKNWDASAMTDYEGSTLMYKDVARKIEKLHILFENAGVNKGDKIALCGRNSSNWGVAFLAILTYGGVAVPILHEFRAEQIQGIVNHSESRLLFVGDHLYGDLDDMAMPRLEGIINIPDYSLLVSRTDKLTEAREHLNEFFGKKYPKYFRAQHVSYRVDEPEELAMISYTSGTTSNPKGVMIPYRAMWSNLEFAMQVLSPKMEKSDHVISMLPMAHMYGMAFEFIFEFCKGCHIFFLTKTPSPNVIFNAFSKIRPRIIITVPLIIEKIIKKKVMPQLETPGMRVLMKLPVINQKLREKICDKITTSFGNNFYEVIVGGAAFNKEVEEFLHKIGFKYTVGYGTTECAPIISYEDWETFVPTSCGKPAPRMEVKIYSRDPEREVGEILCRGANVMLGYYKNPDATAAVLDADGWYHTGDLGTLDSEKRIYIRGRCKNMLLGPSGQNIYPEEIEDKLNNMPYVTESIVIQKNEKLYALVFPDYDELHNDGLDESQLESIMEENRKNVNENVANYEQIAKIKIHTVEFEKTPKKSIKRFLYMDAEV